MIYLKILYSFSKTALLLWSVCLVSHILVYVEFLFWWNDSLENFQVNHNVLQTLAKSNEKYIGTSLLYQMLTHWFSVHTYTIIFGFSLNWNLLPEFFLVFELLWEICWNFTGNYCWSSSRKMFLEVIYLLDLGVDLNCSECLLNWLR